jgi:DNA-binding MarR family transcriptional regulator
LIDPLADIPGYALRRAANAMMSDLASRLSTVETRVTDASVLMLVGANPNVTASEIGRLLDVDRANMVPLLNRIEETGLIERQPIDRKSLGILLTPAGEDRLAQIRAIVDSFEQELIERIPREHREHFLPALNALWQ